MTYGVIYIMDALKRSLSPSLLTYDCKGAKQNAHRRLNSWHALQLFGSHFAVASDIAGAHCHCRERTKIKQKKIQIKKNTKTSQIRDPEHHIKIKSVLCGEFMLSFLVSQYFTV